MLHPTFNDYLKFPNITYKNLDYGNFKTLNANGCIQHGEFLDLDSFNSDDIIIFTDCDIMMQRWFYDDELTTLYELKQNEILLSRNASLNGIVPESLDNLYEEYNKLALKPFESLLENLGENNLIENFKCYNTGVIICRFSTYKRLFRLYLAINSIISHCFSHYASQQWILSYLANKCFKVLSLPKYIHTHTIGKIPDEILFKDNVAYMPLLMENPRPIVFIHHFFGFYH